ncbi:MAG: type II toxin-antitoxin system VapC family toxin [Verrucomicrobiota bacterium]|nr:type II toxin-antitoxin system VapC family toxin [Verrucomicrobiota bacterium]
MYLDSAIIVKLLAREADSAWFNENIVGHELWSSELSLAEVRSALLIKERTGQISIAQRKSAFARFESMHEEKILRLHPLNLPVVERASGLLASCHPEVPLRSLDALHVATALMHPRGPLCATDGRMRAAAQRIGLPCFPENISEIINQ